MQVSKHQQFLRVRQYVESLPDYEQFMTEDEETLLNQLQGTQNYQLAFEILQQKLLPRIDQCPKDVANYIRICETQPPSYTFGGSEGFGGFIGTPVTPQAPTPPNLYNQSQTQDVSQIPRQYQTRSQTRQQSSNQQQAPMMVQQQQQYQPDDYYEEDEYYGDDDDEYFDDGYDGYDYQENGYDEYYQPTPSDQEIEEDHNPPAPASTTISGGIAMPEIVQQPTASDIIAGQNEEYMESLMLDQALELSRQDAQKKRKLETEEPSYSRDESNSAGPSEPWFPPSYFSSSTKPTGIESEILSDTTTKQQTPTTSVVPQEPSEDILAAINVVLILPGGIRKSRRFFPTHVVGQVRNWVETLRPSIQGLDANFHFLTTFPKKVYQDHQSLQECGVDRGRVLLYVENE